jgi:PBP1b-binding outer membrane lipoprotein LpoB
MRKNIFTIAIIAIIFVLTSCEKDEYDNSYKVERYTYNSLVSQNRVILAKSLIESFAKNPNLAALIITECNKKVDGDREVLCKDLFEISTSAKLQVSCNINNSLIRKAKLTTNASNFTSSVINQDSLVQVYYYISEGSDSTSFEGVVIKPEEYVEGEKRELLVINKDGSTKYIRSDVDPTKNYLVISNNERSNSFETNNNKMINAKQKKINSTSIDDGKVMKIVKAKFTSISAKRLVEDWIDGEPEVRLNIHYAVINPTTLVATEVRNSHFYFDKSWLKTGLFSNDVKWNYTLIDCPFWLKNERNYERKLIFTEEDGTTKATTFEASLTDKTTGTTTKSTTSSPATNLDKVFAQSWIDYDLVGEGATYTWGLIQFEISCK